MYAIGSIGFTEDLEHALRVGCVRNDEVAVLVEAVDDQVFDHPTALVQDEVVSRLADVDGRNVVGDDALEQSQGPRPGDLHLAEVRQVEQPHPLPDRSMFRQGAGVLDRHQPAAERSELRPQRGVLLLERRVLELGRGLHRAHRTRGHRSSRPSRVWERG